MHPFAMHPSQVRILQFIEEYIVENGEPPSRREISEGCKMPFTTSNYHLDKLAEAGKLLVRPREPRGIELLRNKTASS